MAAGNLQDGPGGQGGHSARSGREPAAPTACDRALGSPTIPAQQEMEAQLDAQGWAVLPGLLSPARCAAMRGCYPEAAYFRKEVVMAPRGYGRGTYKYFAYPLPDPLGPLRAALYAQLVPTARRWGAWLKDPTGYPDTHADFVARCHAADQRRPTPLLLRYEAGDFNCLHQDVYGPHVFPLQVACLLSAAGEDFTGGDFVVSEQRTGGQARIDVVPLAQGDAVVFAVNLRPVRGARGYHRTRMRHGVGRVRSGHRMTLGLIMHDAA